MDTFRNIVVYENVRQYHSVHRLDGLIVAKEIQSGEFNALIWASDQNFLNFLWNRVVPKSMFIFLFHLFTIWALN